jgi:hypothetical protein
MPLLPTILKGVMFLATLSGGQQPISETEKLRAYYKEQIEHAIKTFDREKFELSYGPYRASKPDKKSLEDLTTMIAIKHAYVTSSSYNEQEYIRNQQKRLAVGVPLALTSVAAFSGTAMLPSEDPSTNFQLDYSETANESLNTIKTWLNEHPLSTNGTVVLGTLAVIGLLYGGYQTTKAVYKWYNAESIVKKRKEIVQNFSDSSY